jgi:uncharacterized OB-fold protein
VDSPNLGPGLDPDGMRARELQAHDRYQRHQETWGDGPPYFSEGTFDFWQNIAQGRFTLGHCAACDSRYFPPRVICPSCWSADAVDLVDTPGVGTVVSYTELHTVSTTLRPIAPVVMVCVDLAEKVRILTWLLGDDDRGSIAVGSPCRIGVEEVLGANRFVARLL